MNGRTLSATAVFIAAVCASRMSFADEEGTPPAGPPVVTDDPPKPEPPTPEPEARTAMKSSPPASTSKKETRWYGWQTLAVDAVATTLMVATVAESREPLEGAFSLLWPTRLLDDPPKTNAAITGSLALYTLGPAFVHALHDRGVQAALSPGIRLFAPTLGTITGAVYGFAAAVVVEILDDGRGNFGSSSPAGTTLILCIGSGYVLGFLAPMLIDAFAFAREPVEPPAEADTKKARAPSFTWRPSFGAAANGVTLGVGGSF